MDQDVLTPEEAAKRLRVSVRTVYRQLKDGRLPGVKVGGQWRIRREELERYLAGEVDDEPLSAEDWAAIRRGLEDIRAGRIISLEQYERERGFDSEH
ncbi:MAG: helix-turn-helix domain-containing protein [Hydrogenibacillus schlegelii]|nr:helix-turn-helix domain-containing protein [Hydrogenibacillus schlegelii]